LKSPSRKWMSIYTERQKRSHSLLMTSLSKSKKGALVFQKTQLPARMRAGNYCEAV